MTKTLLEHKAKTLTQKTAQTCQLLMLSRQDLDEAKNRITQLKFEIQRKLEDEEEERNTSDSERPGQNSN